MDRLSTRVGTLKVISCMSLYMVKAVSRETTVIMDERQLVATAVYCHSARSIFNIGAS